MNYVKAVVLGGNPGGVELSGIGPLRTVRLETYGTDLTSGNQIMEGSKQRILAFDKEMLELKGCKVLDIKIVRERG